MAVLLSYCCAHLFTLNVVRHFVNNAYFLFFFLLPRYCSNNKISSNEKICFVTFYQCRKQN